MERRELGAWGEERAAKYLRSKGYTILERNFRCRAGEIDIIARRGGIITFVEVKLVSHRRELQPRFDVIEIYAPYGERTLFPKINHLEDAFQ